MCCITFGSGNYRSTRTVSVTQVENDHFTCVLKNPFDKLCLIQVDNLSGHADAWKTMVLRDSSDIH